MPSVRKMFSRKSKSLSNLGAGEEAMSQELGKEEIATKKESRRGSLGGKPGKLLGRSLRNMLVKRASKNTDFTPVNEDSARTADMSDSNLAWEQGSTTDTALTTTPPRTAPVMEELEEEVVAEIATPRIMKVKAKEEEAVNVVEDNVVGDTEQVESPEKTPEEEIQEIAAPMEAPEEPSELSQEKESETEELLQGEPFFEEFAEVVPMPPAVPRNGDLLELLNEANIKTEDKVAEVGDEEVHQMVEAAGLEEIEESDEEVDPIAVQTETVGETASESASDSAPEAMTADKARDSMAVAKSKGASTAGMWSPLFIALGVLMVLAVVTIVVEKADILIGLKTQLLSFFQEEVPEEVVGHARPALEVRDGCYGAYCGFYMS